MSEYRIVAKIDPQTSAGANKVKQDLRNIQNEANAATNSVQRSADGSAKAIEREAAQRDRISKMIDRSIAQMEEERQVATAAMNAGGAAVERATQSRASYIRQTEQMRQTTRLLDQQLREEAQATTAATGSKRNLEAMTNRVLRAVDQNAAEQNRLNNVMREAKILLDAGVISQEQYAAAQRLSAQAGAEQNRMSGMQRAGMQQLGYQANDVATMFAMGARPAQIFGSQIGQIAQATQLALGGTSKFAAFLTGPWGIALTVAVIALTPLVAKMLEGNETLDDAVKKLGEEAKATEQNRRAKEAFNRTIEGQIALQRELNQELTQGLMSQRQMAQQSLRQAEASLAGLRESREQAAEAVNDAQRQLSQLEEMFRRGPPIGTQDGNAWAIGMLAGIKRAETELARLQNQSRQVEASISQAERTVRAARVPIQEDQARASTDPIARINREYDIMRDRAVAAALGNEQLSKALGGTLTQIERQRSSALEAAQAQERLNRATSDGVARFRSREQAIGIAGRELQQSGFRVGENNQFGGVTGNHPGMGNTAHGRYAIDVNVGTGVIEADVPELRARFDAAARRYQGRGYRVLWNGWVYEANGDGPTRRIPAGQNQHRDHMHLEAPGTIVGQPTQASMETAARREENQEMRLQERASDFVQAVVNRQASVGLPANNQAQLNAQIDEALAEFTRRFDRAATPDEEATLRKAFTDADARETARRFSDAYVEPLNRLRALQGLTGIERDVMNAKLEETLRLGRELTPIEEAMIETGIREIDQLTRKQQLLQQINGPMDVYRDTIASLNELLDDGAISLTSYNARIAEMASAAAAAVRDMPGVDPTTGRSYADVAAIEDERTRYAIERELFESHREQILQLGIDYDALEEAARRQHMERLAAIDQARKDAQIGAAEEIFGSMTAIAENSVGKQSAVYKALFATEKAAAIARSIIAIQTGIAQASALPFPANLAAMATVAAQTASIVANIRSVSLAFKEGGYVSGPGGPRSDSIPARLSNGEFVVNAKATADNRPLLEAINSGRSVAQGAQARGAAVGAAAPAITVQPAPPAQVTIRQINVADPRMVADYFATPEGEQTFVNLVDRFPEAISRAAGTGN